MKKMPALLFLLFLLLIAYWANTGSMPGWIYSLYQFPLGDKIGHFLLYGVLAYVLSVAMPTRAVMLWRRKLPLGVILAIVFATLEEISQLFLSHRTASLLDLFTGYAGIWAAAFFIPCLKDQIRSPKT